MAVVNLRVVNDNPNEKDRYRADIAFQKMHRAFKRLTKRLGFIREYKRRQEFETNSEKSKRKAKEAFLRRIREENESTRERPPREPFGVPPSAF